MVMNILIEGKRFSTCTEFFTCKAPRSNVPLVVIWPFFTLQVREKECLALQTTHKTRPRIARRSVWDNRQHFSSCLENALGVSIEAHVQMPYIKRQTRVSIFHHPFVSTITPGYRAWNKNHKTSNSAFLSRLSKKRKRLQKLLAA